MSRLVLTGAAGRLGSHLREPLAALAGTLLSSDLVDDIGRCHAGESYVRADLTDLAAMESLLEGADTVVHFGAIGDEAPFETLLGPNFIGAYNVWEAAHRNDVKRVVYASSIHAVGMHPTNAMIGTDAAHRSDTFYGLAKCFAEDLGRTRLTRLTRSSTPARSSPPMRAHGNRAGSAVPPDVPCRCPVG